MRTSDKCSYRFLTFYRVKREGAVNYNNRKTVGSSVYNSSSIVVFQLLLAKNLLPSNVCFSVARFMVVA
jgi:hypothetical protein